ncbi:MAG: hypothetical protein U9Q67_04595 [Patescibacteria group bacterium]|nr:hypothetical protein [Patescibacteria group bacterium]
MRSALKLVCISLLVALLNVALSFVSGINLVWVLAVALLLAELEVTGIYFALVSGFIFDMMMHDSLGSTSIAVLSALTVYVVIRSAGFGESSLQKYVLIILSMFLTFVFSSLLGWALGDVSYSSWIEFFSWIYVWLVNSGICVVLYLFIVNKVQTGWKQKVVRLR